MITTDRKSELTQRLKRAILADTTQAFLDSPDLNLEELIFILDLANVTLHRLKAKSK